jgi:branched-chain amino acid transport system permease protein
MSKQTITRHMKLIGLIVVIIIFAFIPLFIHSPYLLDLFIIMIVNAILAMTFIMMLRTGLISMSVCVFWGLGAYASAVLATKFHLSFWLLLPVSAVITGIIAFGLGFVLLGKGTNILRFVIFSCILGMLFNVAIGSTPALGGYNGINNIPPPNPIRIPFMPPVEFVSKVQYFYLALLLLLIVFLICKAFYSAWTGRAWIAIGLSSRLAESIGVNVFRYRLLAFIVSSIIAGLIGSFYAHYESFINPGAFAMWQNVYVQLYAILGGIAYPIWGPLIGSAVMTFVPEYLRIAREVAPIFTGVLLILLILFLPQGLLGLMEVRTSVMDKVVKIGKTIESSLIKIK